MGPGGPDSESPETNITSLPAWSVERRASLLRGRRGAVLGQGHLGDGAPAPIRGAGQGGALDHFSVLSSFSSPRVKVQLFLPCLLLLLLLLLTAAWGPSLRPPTVLTGCSPPPVPRPAPSPHPPSAEHLSAYNCSSLSSAWFELHRERLFLLLPRTEARL